MSPHPHAGGGTPSRVGGCARLVAAVRRSSRARGRPHPPDGAPDQPVGHHDERRDNATDWGPAPGRLSYPLPPTSCSMHRSVLVCGHPAGRLHDGRLPGSTEGAGFVELVGEPAHGNRAGAFSLEESRRRRSRPRRWRHRSRRRRQLLGRRQRLEKSSVRLGSRTTTRSVECRSRPVAANTGNVAEQRVLGSDCRRRDPAARHRLAGERLPCVPVVVDRTIGDDARRRNLRHRLTDRLGHTIAIDGVGPSTRERRRRRRRVTNSPVEVSDPSGDNCNSRPLRRASDFDDLGHRSHQWHRRKRCGRQAVYVDSRRTGRSEESARVDGRRSGARLSGRDHAPAQHVSKLRRPLRGVHRKTPGAAIRFVLDQETGTHVDEVISELTRPAVGLPEGCS